MKNFTEENGNLKNVKLFLLVCGKEGDDTDKDTQKMEILLLKTGLNPVNLKINPEGEHNEAFWKSEFLEVVSWLYHIK